MFIDESRVVRYKSHNNEENKEIIDDVETDGEMLNNAYLGAFENSKMVSVEYGHRNSL